MTHLTVAYRRSSGGRAGLTSRTRSTLFFEAFGRWLSDWRAHLRRARAESQLRRKLEGYDDHLLRDMGLMYDGYALREMESIWTARRPERIGCARSGRC